MSKRILMVEDTEDNRQIVRDLMESVGYHLIEAEDGAAGVAMAAEHRPDLILMDIQLPVMDGYEACRRLRSEPRTARATVVMLTAAAGEEAEREAEEAGADLFLTKPFSPLELLRLVHDLGDGALSR